jgi:hypothetical protein
MSEEPTLPTAEEIGAAPGLRHWIDLVLLAGAVGAAAAWGPAAAVPLLVLGAALPLAAARRRRSVSSDRLRDLVPDEVAAAHRRVVALAATEHTQHRAEVLTAADDTLLDVIAVLGGREPRGGAQRRFVAAHLAALEQTAASLQEWHDAREAALAELVVLVPEGTPPPLTRPDEPAPALAKILLVALLPLFAAWELVILAARAIVALADGVLLRARTLVVVSGRGLVRAGRSLSVARALWTDARAAVVLAAREAARDAIAIRARVRVQVRRAMRSRRLRAGQ